MGGGGVVTVTVFLLCSMGRVGLVEKVVRGGDMVFGVGGVKRGDENCDIKQQLENFPSFACSSSSSRGIMRVVVLLVGVRVCE